MSIQRADAKMLLLPVHSKDVELVKVPQAEDKKPLNKGRKHGVPLQVPLPWQTHVKHRRYRESLSIELENTQKPSIGTLLSVERFFGRVVVQGIREGSVNAWNEDFNGTKQRLQVGDQIMSVNGVDVDSAAACKRELSKVGVIKTKLMRPLQYVFHFDRAGEENGCTLENRFIKEIQLDGWLERWIRANPDAPLTLGDVIIECNGKVECDEISDELNHSKSITMVIAHHRTPSSWAK